MKLKGFSLIEAMVATSLLLIVVALVMVNASFLRSSMVRSEIDKLSMVCKCMQSTALTTNKKQELHIDLVRNVYTWAGQREKLSEGIEFGVLPDVKGPPSAPRVNIDSPVTFDKQCITASAHGIMNAGTVYIIDQQKTVMYALSSSVAQSSYIRKYAFQGSWHLVR